MKFAPDATKISPVSGRYKWDYLTDGSRFGGERHGASYEVMQRYAQRVEDLFNTTAQPHGAVLFARQGEMHTRLDAVVSEEQTDTWLESAERQAQAEIFAS